MNRAICLLALGACHASPSVGPPDAAPNPDASAPDGAVALGRFVALGGPVLRVVDASDPAAPTVVGTYQPPGGSAWGPRIQGRHAFTIDAHDPAAGVLAVLDLSTPSAITSLSSATLDGGQIGGLENPNVIEGTLELVGELGSLEILDVAGDAPVHVGALPLVGSVRGLAVGGGYAYVAIDAGDLTTGEVAIVDVSNPSAPARVGSWATPTGTPPWGLALAGSHVLVTTFTGALHVLDVVDPAHPTPVGSLQAGKAKGMSVVGSRVYTAAGHKLHVIDVRDPEQPVIAASATTSADAISVIVDGGYAYVTENLGTTWQYGGRLEIFDVSTPTPTALGRVELPSGPGCSIDVAAW